MNPEKLEAFERCPRLAKWEQDHVPLRVKPLGALYEGVKQGLAGKDPKDAVLSLAAQPGLDIEGQETYSTAIHLAHLAEILTAYLKPLWSDDLRRLVLIDRWSEDRKMQEIRSWKTIAPICTQDQPMLITFITIGQVIDNRRLSAWTRGWTHPQNGGLKFRKKDGSSLGEGWQLQWRERSALSTDRWLGKMQSENPFSDLVHTIRVPVPRRRDEWLREIKRIEGEIAALPDNPPMNRGGCYRFSPCQFTEVCHSSSWKVPSDCGWIRIEDITKLPRDLPKFANVG